MFKKKKKLVGRKKEWDNKEGKKEKEKERKGQEKKRSFILKAIKNKSCKK